MMGFDATLIYEGKQRDRFGEEQTDFTRTLTRRRGHRENPLTLQSKMTGVEDML